MANFGPLTAEIGKFQRVSSLAFVTAATSLTRGQPNFVRCLAVSWAGTLYIQFRGLLSSDGILSGSKFILRPNLAFSYIGSVKAKFHYAIWSQTGPKLVADLQRAEIWPII